MFVILELNMKYNDAKHTCMKLKTVLRDLSNDHSCLNSGTRYPGIPVAMLSDQQEIMVK